MAKMADAIDRDVASEAESKAAAPESQGAQDLQQASDEVQLERCLTDDGIAAMLGRLRNLDTAKTYLGIAREGVRVSWLKAEKSI